MKGFTFQLNFNQKREILFPENHQDSFEHSAVMYTNLADQILNKLS